MDSTLLLRQLCMVVALSCFGVYVVKSDSTNEELREYLKHFNSNRHHVTNPDGKTHARDFIRDTFNSFGLHTWTESFLPKPPDKEVATGENIISLLPGRLAGTRDDRLILIGSHYDTMRRTTGGVDDNGSGVVALLRVARLLTAKWAKCTREYSVMFVAFDFEEWESSTLPGCACSSLGCGSRAFVGNFSQYYNLFPNMSIARYGQLQGAIIMDTMMNYNSTPYSQHMEPIEQQLIQKVFPEQYNAIAYNSFKGDFLILVGRYSNDDQLLNAFSYYYKKDKTKYKLQVFPLPFHGPPSKLPERDKSSIRPFLRSDHVSFWNGITSNRAIFLSDTANMRSYMRTCYHEDCDSMSHVTDDFLGFLSKSCDTIVMTTDDLTKARCKTNSPTQESSEMSTGGSIVLGMFISSVIAAIGACCWCYRKKKFNDDLVANAELPNRSATNPVFVGSESEGTGNTGSGNTRTGNTRTGNTRTGNTGTGNTGTETEPNVYEAVEPRWNINEASVRRPATRKPGKSGTSETQGTGPRGSGNHGRDSIA